MNPEAGYCNRPMRPSKYLYTAFLCLFFIHVNSQDYERVDAAIQLYPDHFQSAEDLSYAISRDFDNAEDKLRAIYGWIIQNVSYDPAEYKNFNYNFKNYRERNQKEEKTRAKVILRTLQEGVAVCEGYAMLFERLCELQGIQNYLVRGDIKTHFNDIGRPFNKNHMWNVVLLDGKSYLFDPTWGAGKYQGKFIKEPTYFYYMIPPEQMIKTHYPDVFEDAFVSYQMSYEEFSELPLIIDEEVHIEDVRRPSGGRLLSADYFGEIPFELKMEEQPEVSFSYGNENENVESVLEEGRLKFSIPLELGRDHLLIYFNDKPALGFKIE